MHVSLVMTVIGDDRPGLVGSISRAVADHDGNWLESHMTRLAGKFAGILRVEVPADKTAALETRLHELASTGLHVIVEAGRDEALESGILRAADPLLTKPFTARELLSQVADALAR